MSSILTLNAGSSSVKFAVYGQADDAGPVLSGQVEGLGLEARLVLLGPTPEVFPVEAASHQAALDLIMSTLDARLGTIDILGVGHRVVHGGPLFDQPEELTPETLKTLEGYVPLAPLHQPHNLAMVAAAADRFPRARHIGCFDTSFHRGHPWVNDTFALPRKFYEDGIRRYGFHGLSYDYIATVLKEDWPDLFAGRVVVAHLGNGASMCALRAGRSVGSSMGFSALDGLPMGTRSGQIDPGVLLHLLKKGYTVEDLQDLLYRRSGLLGLSGISSDMRHLHASDDPKAAEAIDYYVFRIRRELGAMAAVLGGLDGLVFCGGVGENAAFIRDRVADGMAFLGLSVDGRANADNATRIDNGPCPILVIPTNEELVLARAVRDRLAGR